MPYLFLAIATLFLSRPQRAQGAFPEQSPVNTLPITAAPAMPNQFDFNFSDLFNQLRSLFSFTQASAGQHTQTDLDTLARTMWGEARGEGKAGLQAVANVVMNRYYAAQKSNAKGSQYGRTVTEICRKPYQFSAWLVSDPTYAAMVSVTDADPVFRQCLDIAQRALNGQLADITGGADHYLNITATKQQRGGSLPSWVDMNKRTASIGSHTFLRLA